MRVPTPALQGASELGGVAPVAKQSSFVNLSYPTPPVNTFAGTSWQGQMMQQLGGNIVSAANAYQQQYDQAMLLKAENDWWELEKQLNDPNSGLWSQFGMNAVGSADAMTQIVDKFRDDHNYGNLSASGRRALDKMIGQYGVRAVTGAQDFERTQVRQATIDEANSGIALQIDRATLAPMTEAGDQEFNAALGQITSKVAFIGQQEGWSPTQIAEVTRANISAAVIGRVTSVADGTLGTDWDPSQAMDLLESAKQQGWVTGEHYNKMYSVLDKMIVQQEGMKSGTNAARWDGEALYGVRDAVTGEATAAMGTVTGMGAGTRMNPGTIATGLAPAYSTGIEAFSADIRAATGGGLQISSGFRSPSQQYDIISGKLAQYGFDAAALQGRFNQLVAENGGNRDLAAIAWGQEFNGVVTGEIRQHVAMPGFSNHQKGTAADVKWNGMPIASAPAHVKEYIYNNAERFGFYFPLTPEHGLSRGTWREGQYKEPWHMELLGTRGTTASPYGGAAMTYADNTGGITAANLGQVGGYNGSTGSYYEGFGSSGKDHNAGWYDYSIMVAEYTFTPPPNAGYVAVGTRDGKTVYRAPDYAKDANGNYLMLDKEQTLAYAQQRGWLIPTQDEVRAFAENPGVVKIDMPTRVTDPPAGSGIDRRAHQEQQRASFIEEANSKLGGLAPDRARFYGKELFTDSVPAGVATSTNQIPVFKWLKSYDGGAPSGDLINAAVSIAGEFNLPPQVFLALIQAESSWNPNIRSSAGAFGLTQLMPGTADMMGVTNSADPIQNMRGGARYLAEQYAKYGDWSLALAAYNAGPGNVDKHGGIPPFKETQDYVRKILSWSGDPDAAFPMQPGPLTYGAPAGMPPGAAAVFNMPTGTARERAIRASAMETYTSEMAFMTQAQNRGTAALMDDVYTRIIEAGPGSSLHNIVSPTEIAQLGTQMDSVINFHQKISSGGAVTPDHDVHFAWREMAMSDPAAFVEAFQDSANRAFLRESLSTSQYNELDTLYGTASQQLAEVQKGGVALEDPNKGATYTMSQARSYADDRLSRYGMETAQRNQLSGQIASMMFDSAQAKFAESGVEITSEAAMAEAFDRATKLVGLEGEAPTTFAELMMPADDSPGALAKVDEMFDSSSDDLIDALVEGEGLLGNNGGAIPLNRYQLENMQRSYAHDHAGRTPTASQLLEEIMFWAYLELGETAYTPISMAGNARPQAWNPPMPAPGRPAAVREQPYQVPGYTGRGPTAGQISGSGLGIPLPGPSDQMGPVPPGDYKGFGGMN